MRTFEAKTLSTLISLLTGFSRKSWHEKHSVMNPHTIKAVINLFFMAVIAKIGS